MESNFIKTLKLKFLESDVVVGSNVLCSLEQYFSLTEKWGGVINITNNITLDRFIVENILDPVLAYQAFSKKQKFNEEKKLIDVGCGGGYVGIVWHILAQGSFETTLLDGDRKKINFCKQVIRDLGLEKIHAFQCRIENHDLSSYDIVVSRATWDQCEFYKQCHKNNPHGSWLLHFSSKKQKENQYDESLSVFPYHMGGVLGERYIVGFLC